MSFLRSVLSSPLPAARTGALLAGAAILVGAPAEAARLKPAGTTASSHYPDEGGLSYTPDRASDGKTSTAWVEGDAGSGLGAWLEIDLGEERQIEKIKIWGGLWFSSDYWKRANRPKDIEVVWGDGTKDTFTLKDEMKPQEFPLAQARRTKTARIRIKSIYDGSTWLDTAISEVQLFDATAEDRVTPRSITASTVHAADADGSYDPLSVSDGIADSMWCEGNKAGDGSGDWLQFQFGAKQTVSKLTLINGVGTSMQVWMNSNRAGTATLAFSDGSTETLTLKNSVLPQTLTFAPRATESVKVTFTGITRGKDANFNDLCISEAYFSQ